LYLSQACHNTGLLADITVYNEQRGRNFFESAGWDVENRKPSLDVLQRLGHLDEVIKDLYEIRR
jgi:hypothetical protein